MNLLGKEHGGVNCFLLPFLSNACGVAILIRPNMSFDLRVLKHIVKGRYIHLCIAINDVVLRLLMYTHHQETVQSALIVIQLSENMCYRILVKILLLWQEILVVHSTPSMIEQARMRATSILLFYYMI